MGESLGFLEGGEGWVNVLNGIPSSIWIVWNLLLSITSWTLLLIFLVFFSSDTPGALLTLFGPGITNLMPPVPSSQWDSSHILKWTCGGTYKEPNPI